MRIPAGPAGAVEQAGLRAIERLSDQVVVFSDGTVHLDVAKLGVPTDVYDADFAWAQHRHGVVRCFFGQEGQAGTLHTCLQVKLSREAFVHHLWGNSLEFYERLGRRAAARGALVDQGRDALTPESWEVEKRHSLSANFTVMSHAGNEAQIDFFHLPPSGVAAWIKNKDGHGMKVSPKVRVLLTTDELFRLLKEAERIVAEIEPLVKNKDLL